MGYHNFRQFPIMEKEHVLDYSDIDDYDEISGEEQLTLIWCNTHKQYEWHWLLKRENI